MSGEKNDKKSVRSVDLEALGEGGRDETSEGEESGGLHVGGV